MNERPMQRGWEAFDALPARSPSKELIVDLKEPMSLLILADGRVSQVRVTPAPDGEYELQRSGKVVVQKGEVREIAGVPDASASAPVTP